MKAKDVLKGKVKAAKKMPKMIKDRTPKQMQGAIKKKIKGY